MFAVPVNRLLRCLLFAFGGVLLTSCQLFWSPKSPGGYVMPRPKKIVLGKTLNETSGLFYLQNENAMITVADNKQKIYRITQEGKVDDYFEQDFGPPADYEDVVRVDSSVYVLVSDGSIVEVVMGDSGLQTITHPFEGTGKNDFETLYHDSASNSLVMICKNCASEKGRNIRTAYRFDLSARRFDAAPAFTISSKEVKNSLKDGQIAFEPSAAAIHPLEGRLYILASAGNLMVVTDLKGVVQQVFRLNPTLYPQAEGIAFAPNGDMYVTNEAKLGKPTLLHIPYKPAGD